MDYRLYGDGVFFDLDSEQYSVESLNNTDPLYSEAWPGQEVPDAQLDADPPNEFEVALDGSLAFAWHTLVAEVDSIAGEAVFLIDDIEIGIVIPDLNGGAVEGNVALTMADVFSSVAPIPDSRSRSSTIFASRSSMVCCPAT